MKLNTAPAGATRRVNKLKTSMKAGVPKGFRRLKANERVIVGDFVADERQGVEPWQGLTGFRADSFEKPIYRPYVSRTSATKKSK